jgi:hypothetical protein
VVEHLGAFFAVKEDAGAPSNPSIGRSVACYLKAAFWVALETLDEGRRWTSGSD